MSAASQSQPLSWAFTMSSIFSSMRPQPQPDGEERVVTLRWNSTQPTGLDLSVGDGFTLRVKSVDNSGAIGDWNRDHPSQKVMSGDIIVDVNGRSRNSNVMLLEMKETSTLRMVVRRIPEVSSLIHMLQYRDLDPEDFELLRSLDETSAPKPEGAVQLKLNALPKVEAWKCQSRTCWICLENNAPDTLVTRLPCDHAFCTQCIQTWVTKCKSNCPICQASIDEGSTCASENDVDESDVEVDDDNASVSKEVDKYGLRFSENPLPRLALGGATRGRSFSISAKKAWL